MSTEAAADQISQEIDHEIDEEADFEALQSPQLSHVPVYSLLMPTLPSPVADSEPEVTSTVKA